MTHSQASRTFSKKSPELFDHQQIAEYLNVSVRHAKRLTEERRVPVVKIGRFVRVERSALDTYIAANTRSAV